jgi:hypothetical protein
MAKKLDSATKGGSCKSGARATTRKYFLSTRASMCLRVTIKYNGCNEIREIDMCMDFEVLRAKVPFRFSDTVGFSSRREGH